MGVQAEMLISLLLNLIKHDFCFMQCLDREGDYWHPGLEGAMEARTCHLDIPGQKIGLMGYTALSLCCTAASNFITLAFLPFTALCRSL